MKLWAFAFVIFIVCLQCAGAARAQSPSLQGTYVLDSHASDDVAKIVDAVVARMPIWKRPFARSRLSRTAEPPQRLTIAYSGAEVTITMDAHPPTRTAIDGAFGDWTTPAGEKMKVSTTTEGARLKRVFEASDGRRLDTFSLNATGDMLIFETAISSPELPQPLAYKLVFRRVT